MYRLIIHQTDAKNKADLLRATGMGNEEAILAVKMLDFLGMWSIGGLDLDAAEHMCVKLGPLNCEVKYQDPVNSPLRQYLKGETDVL